MAKQYLLNAFSINMIEREGVDTFHKLYFREIDLATAQANLTDGVWVSGVGHADTAAVFSSQLDTPVECNRITVSLESGDRAIVGQYTGPRLPEGAKELPEGATIQWWLVTL